MFVCPICKKKFENLDEYTMHINEENKSDKAKAKKDKELEKKAASEKIYQLYAELKELINKFNETYKNDSSYFHSELKYVNKRTFESFPEYSSESNTELADLFCKALFGDK